MELRGPSELKVGAPASFGVRASVDLTRQPVLWRFSGPTYFELVGSDIGVTFGVEGVYQVTASLPTPEGEVLLGSRTIIVQAPNGRPPGTPPPSPVQHGGAPPPPPAPTPAPEEVQPEEESTPQPAPSETTSTRSWGSWSNPYTLGLANPKAIAVGDLDGDGRADLAVVDAGARSIRLFKALSDGEFEPKGQLELSFGPEKVLVAHFAGSGLADVLAVSFTARMALLWTSLAPFKLANPVKLGLPLGATDVWAWPLNEHPAFELVWTTLEGPRVWSLIGDGRSVVEWPTVPEGLALAPPSSLYAWADLTGHGQPELVFCSLNPGEVFVLLAPSKPVALGAIPAGVIPAGFAAGDINGDGLVDLMIVDTTGKVHIWLNPWRGGGG